VKCSFYAVAAPLRFYTAKTQAVWKRFSYPNNCKQPGAMDLEAIG